MHAVGAVPPRATHGGLAPAGAIFGPLPHIGAHVVKAIHPGLGLPNRGMAYAPIEFGRMVNGRCWATIFKTIGALRLLPVG